MSYYRPGPRQHGISRPPSPPPPLPRGPPPRLRPPPNDMYRFGGGESWRPGDRDHRLDQFSFRNNQSAPQYPPAPGVNDYYRPMRSRPHAEREQRHRPHGNIDRYRPEHEGDHHSSEGQRSSYFNRRPATSERALLTFQNRGTTPDQMPGMMNGAGTSRFKAAEDISESGGEDMDMSESDQDSAQLTNTVQAREIQDNPSIVTEPDQTEPPVKRRNLGSTFGASKDSESVPKWSNPDPYTVLPPPDETLRKKKDVVQIIRKARLSADKTIEYSRNEVAANNDFISLEFGEAEGSENEEDVDDVEQSMGLAAGVPGAPWDPRSNFSHVRNFHKNILTDSAPPEGKGATTLTASSDPANPLGSRKRTHDDTIKEIQPSTAQARKQKMLDDGKPVLREWKSSGDPCPWLADRNGLSENAGFQLHKEICDFYEFVRPQGFEQTVREDLLSRLQILVRKYSPNCDVHSFGSFAGGLYLPTADMDVVLISHSFAQKGVPTICTSKTQIRNFAGHIQRSGIAVNGSVDTILFAKVPLVKFVDSATNLRVDISFENNSGITANAFFKIWKQQYPCLPHIVALIKQFLLMRGLNEVNTGGLGGFSVICLVTSLLQHMPRVQSGELVPELHLGETLLEFLDLYGNQFDTSRTGILLDPPGYFDKRRSSYGVYQQNKADRLAIMAPNMPGHDISGGSKNVPLIFKCFSHARVHILSAMETPLKYRSGILESMLGGDYGSFVWQRNRLRSLYESKWGAIQYPVTAVPKTVSEDAEGWPPSYVENPKPSRKNGKAKSHERANKLRETYPGMRVPATVGRKTAQTMIKDYLNGTSSRFPKSKSKHELSEDKLARDRISRANQLRKELPDMQGIPDQITKGQRRALVDQFKGKTTASGPQEQGPTRKMPPRQCRTKTTTKTTPKSKAKLRARPIDVMGPISAARRAEVARNLGGTSAGDPITID